MSKSPDRTSAEQLFDHLLVQEVCSAPDALEAHRRFERHVDDLKDWQIIYAENSDVGSIKLLNLTLGPSGIATSIFRGKSLWLMDAPFVSGSGPVGFVGGHVVFVDSNAASFIRSIAYEDEPSTAAMNGAALINQVGPRLQQLNPSLYLWESLRNWNKETIDRCKESVAAIHALSSSVKACVTPALTRSWSHALAASGQVLHKPRGRKPRRTPRWLSGAAAMAIGLRRRRDPTACDASRRPS